MSDLIVIAFPTEAKAEEVRQKLLTMQKEYLLELGDAVIAMKDDKGQIKLNQMINTTAAGAVGGAFWGALIGLIFLMPLAGAALGAAGVKGNPGAAEMSLPPPPPQGEVGRREPTGWGIWLLPTPDACASDPPLREGQRPRTLHSAAISIFPARETPAR